MYHFLLLVRCIEIIRKKIELTLRQNKKWEKTHRGWYLYIKQKFIIISSLLLVLERVAHLTPVARDLLLISC